MSAPWGAPTDSTLTLGGAGGKSEGVLQVAPPPHRTVRRRSDTDCWTGVYFWRSGVRNRCQETNLEGESKTTFPEAEAHFWETKKTCLGSLSTLSSWEGLCPSQADVPLSVFMWLKAPRVPLLAL